MKMFYRRDAGRVYWFGILSLILITRGPCSIAQSEFSWPGNARAAVCLTYDDGLDCHVDIVAPALEQHGLRGTFYVTGTSPSLYHRMEEWRGMAERGHELGNHTLFHPCHREGNDWVRPEYDLDNYTFPQLMNELRVANSLLKAVDGKEERTFAYTCTHTTIAGISFVDSIRTMFLAARGGGAIPDRMEEIDIHNVPSWMAVDRTGADLISYVEQAVEKGTLAVIMFHSVGGGYLNVSEEAHEQLLGYLEQHRGEIWTAPFREVMEVAGKELQKGSTH